VNALQRPEIPPVPASHARPRWSVMIPTYNCAAYLRQTLESILEQDPGPDAMQIEVVDDWSTDDPQAVVDELAPSRVGFHRQPENVGAVRNFNTCLLRARGELVHLLHGDDWVRDGFYETMARPFANPEIGAAFCRYVAADDSGNWQKIASLEQPIAGILPDWLAQIAEGQRLQTPCMVVRRAVYEAVGGFDARLEYAEDWEMWVRIAARYAVWYEPEPLAVYRVHTSSLSGQMLRTGENVRRLRLAVETNAHALPPDRVEEINRAAYRSTALAALQRGRRLMGAGDTAGMWAQVREALRSDRSLEVAARAAFLVGLRIDRALRGLARRRR
jgi:cellulose synthase/poly-beta-1,6-N-acetylglucosamine synthase-like glycosyltransferase